MTTTPAAAPHPARAIAPLACAIALAASAASADIVWDEAVDGDLSTDPDAPTPLVFDAGFNTIKGSVQSPSDTRDYITFEVPDGYGLFALIQRDYRNLDTGGPGNRGFHAINEGDTSYIPGNDTIDNFLGGDHMDPETPGTDLLPDLAAGTLGGSGFDVPLGPGVYSYVIQQTGPQHTGYELDFVLRLLCIADFNIDGDVNTLDVLAFLNAWNAGEAAADVNLDGEVNTLDVLFFLNEWNNGCP